MTLVATQVKRRRGTTAENDAFTGAEGEIVVDTERHELRVHDGSTVGGYRIPTKDYGYSKTESDDLLSNKADTSLSNITPAGKEVCANMSMPSNTYDTLTLGTSGSTYTAPADGYFVCRIAPASNDRSYLNLSGAFTVTYKSYNDGNYLSGFIPVRKGGSVQITYLNKLTNTGEFLRFYYAQGAQ